MRRRWILACGVLIVVAVASIGGYAFARSNSTSSIPRASGWFSYAPLAAGASGGISSTRPRAARPKAHSNSARPGYGVDIQAIYDTAGNPSLVANFSPDGGLPKPRWSICSPSSVNVCRPANNATQFLTPGPTPAGTVFQATATYEGKTYVARSAPWLGTVRATVPPRLNGHPRYGAAVTPHGASWTGGWQSDSSYKPQDGGDSGGRGPNFDFLSVEACRTRAARRCVNLSAPTESYGFSKRPPVVGAWFTGWYLFAFDQRLAHDTAFAQPGYRTPAVVPAVKAGATVARSAPVGPVIGPRAPRGVDPARRNPPWRAGAGGAGALLGSLPRLASGR